MQFAYRLGGGAPLIRKFMAGETIAEGIGVGVAVSTETGVVGHDAAEGDVALLGLSVDGGGDTYSTTQATDGSDIEAEVAVVINPDAVFRARLSGGTGSGTDLVQYTVDTADTGGTSINTDTASGGAKEEGTIWGYSGSNVGQKRKIITDDDAGTFGVTVPFLGTAVGDVFLVAGFFLGSDNVNGYVTTDFTELDMETDVVAGASAPDYNIVGQELNDLSNEGLSNSWGHVLIANHWFNNSH